MKLSLALSFSLLASGLAYGAEGQAPAAAEAAPAQAAAPAATEGSSAPSESVCKSGENTRRVKLDVTSEKCLVIYVKETEKPGTEDTLYRYDHEIDKCKQKYSEFVEKLRGMQWTCS